VGDESTALSTLGGWLNASLSWARARPKSRLACGAPPRGQTSAAIRAEELRGQLQRFYVKQVETGDAGEFSRMSDEELRAYVNGEKLPPKDTTKH
jgi:hypothetical protein